MLKFFQKSPESKNFEKLKEIIEKAKSIKFRSSVHKEGGVSSIYSIGKFEFVELKYLYTSYDVYIFEPKNGQLKNVNLTKRQAKTLFEMAKKKNLFNL